MMMSEKVHVDNVAILSGKHTNTQKHHSTLSFSPAHNLSLSRQTSE